jgi:hypothetical protein
MVACRLVSSRIIPAQQFHRDTQLLFADYVAAIERRSVSGQLAP